MRMAATNGAILAVLAMGLSTVQLHSVALAAKMTAREGDVAQIVILDMRVGLETRSVAVVCGTHPFKLCNHKLHDSVEIFLHTMHYESNS